MKVLNSTALTAVFLLLMLDALAPVRADEGFWTFDRVPVQLIESRTGVHLTPEWVRHVQQSTVRYNGGEGGSASFVSADGLLLTNFHVNRPTLRKLQTPQRDIIRDGYLARSLDQEIPLPEVSLDALISTEDVTGQVRGVAAATEQASDDESARLARIQQIERSATRGPNDVAEVVPLFDGGRYVLYRYKRYTDVRLVFSPEYSAVGLTTLDFWYERQYPAPTVDFAFIRAYENGRPARPEQYLRWSDTGPRAGSIIFVAGAPTYSRHLGSVAELEFRRDVLFPQGADVYARLENALSAWANRSQDRREAAKTLLILSSMRRLLFTGPLTTLRDPKFWESKHAWERQIRDELSEQGAAQALAAYAAIESINNNNDYVEAFTRSHVLPIGEPTWQLYPIEQAWDSMPSEDLVGPLYLSGLTLLRSHAESQKPDGSRARGYRDAERQGLRRWLESFAQINPDIETVRLKVWLESLILQLGANDPITLKALHHESPAVRAAQLAHGTKLIDQSTRQKLLGADAAAFDAMRDPMIDLLRELEPDIERIDRPYRVLAERCEAARETIIQAMANLRRTPVYPNANRTVRLEYGTVEGYMTRSQLVPAVTDLKQVYDWSEHQYESVPYTLSPAWKDARAKIDLSAPLNFLTNADSLGGNSGSATVDSEGRLVGILCCGINLDLAGAEEFAFYAQKRSGHVATAAILEVLKQVYDARELLQEISQGHR